jgi:hypothetical protein
LGKNSGKQRVVLLVDGVVQQQVLLLGLLRDLQE